MADLTIVPTIEGFSLDESLRSVLTPLLGGAPRVRADLLGGWDHAKLQWTLTGARYAELRTFYDVTLSAGSAIFGLPVYSRSGTVTTHQAFFTPETFGLDSVADGVFVVKAEVEVNRSTDSVSTTWVGTRVPLVPKLERYKLKTGPTTLSVRHDSPAPTVRADRANTWDSVTVLWICTAQDYADLHGFIETTLAGGSLPCSVYLLSRAATKMEHTAYFTPGGLRLVEVQGPDIFSVEADLAVDPVPLA